DLTQARRMDSSECALDANFPSSPIYAAPEMFTIRGCLTAAADIYAVGVLLFEMLAGRPPFTDGSPRQLALCHRREAPPDVLRFRSDASPEVGELLRRVLAKEPLRRPTGEQLVRWLAELEIEELATTARFRGGRPGQA